MGSDTIFDFFQLEAKFACGLLTLTAAGNVAFRALLCAGDAEGTASPPPALHFAHRATVKAR